MDDAKYIGLDVHQATICVAGLFVRTLPGPLHRQGQHRVFAV